MSKRILVIPDIHGRTFWKEPINKYIDSVDKMVFLGDYLDPYEDEGEEHDPDDIFQNLMEIINLKLDNWEKVVLLKGNHDQHYYSKRFCDLAAGTRMDEQNWDKYHEVFGNYRSLFQFAHMEVVKGITYVFTHAGLTLYWLHKVNTNIWQLPDNKVSMANEDIINRINQLDYEPMGQEMLSVVGRNRSWLGEKTGSVLWADIREHSLSEVPEVYGLNKVIQVFGHTRLNGHLEDSIESGNLVMIDSQKCFMIDENIKEKILSIRDYEKRIHSPSL